MKTKKFENLHALTRKINTRALLLDPKPSRPILAVKKKKDHLYSSPEAEYRPTYRPTDLLLGFKSSINIDVYIFNIFLL